MSTQYKICNCNHTMPLDAAAGARLGAALGTDPLPVASGLCRHAAEAGQQHAVPMQAGERVVVGCTQEQARLGVLVQQQNNGMPVQFVNIRETGNWGSEARESLAKTAALLAAAALPAAEPVPSVRYASSGSTLIIGRAEQALPWAERLRNQLPVQVLLTGGSASEAMLHEPGFQLFSGDRVTLSGWLGAFTVSWQQTNPIDLALCIGCHACVEACPEQAISVPYQINTDLCQQHGDCTVACGSIGAIDFSRSTQQRQGHFDLILDLSETPLIQLHQPPQGYFAPGSDPIAQFTAVLQLSQMIGEFEKPKYFNYKERLCAHSRNRKVGCHACIDVCSAQAIASSGDRIQVNPHLCVGCGACTTVCPSGALGYAYPAASHTGKRLKAALAAYASAGGQQAVILLHSEKQGRVLVQTLGRLARTSNAYQGMPARLIPLEVQHTASVGIDLWLAAVAYGASGIAVLVTDEEAPQYVAALAGQMRIAQTVVTGLGYEGVHFQLIEASTPAQLDASLRVAPAGAAPVEPATFHVASDKRNTLDFVLDHLYRHAPVKPDAIALPAGAPFGAIEINTAACTLCMACIGACPESALMNNSDKPQLRFAEKNCVQCGLCVQTCPEAAISLVPRLAFTEASKKAVMLNEGEPFCCIRCNKPIGTLQMIEAMLGKLSQHSAFSGNLDLLKMCGDCRVIDMLSARRGAKIVELVPPSGH